MKSSVLPTEVRHSERLLRPATAGRRAVKPKRYLCIHFPHKVSSTMLDIARLPGVIKVLVDVIGPNVKMMQSMLFIKSEGKPDQAWHQDEAHYMSAESLLPWFPSSGHQAMCFLDHRDICLVAGTDPYAWKGTADLMHPHVWPDGDGGCAR